MLDETSARDHPKEPMARLAAATDGLAGAGGDALLHGCRPRRNLSLWFVDEDKGRSLLGNWPTPSSHSAAVPSPRAPDAVRSIRGNGLFSSQRITSYVRPGFLVAKPQAQERRACFEALRCPRRHWTGHDPLPTAHDARAAAQHPAVPRRRPCGPPRLSPFVAQPQCHWTAPVKPGSTRPGSHRRTGSYKHHSIFFHFSKQDNLEGHSRPSRYLGNKNEAGYNSDREQPTRTPLIYCPRPTLLHLSCGQGRVQKQPSSQLFGRPLFPRNNNQPSTPNNTVLRAAGYLRRYQHSLPTEAT
ncbi:hypothetical protein ACCO45_010180 [Purpureocillium lilacinum]|uniref:Uncharacterized protein n=1 Tax=Purpureocillium lilacinum TaxID=33203 RepID=A0ACC4DFL7_PURLI